MRKFSLILVVLALLTSGSIFANEFNSTEPSNDLSTQIGILLDENSFIVEDDLTANVQFTLNDQMEIVVLTVETDNEMLESFVKSRLNYEKVESKEYKVGKTYSVPIRITAS